VETRFPPRRDTAAKFRKSKNAPRGGRFYALGLALISERGRVWLPSAMAKRKPNAAFMKPVQPDDKLAVVVGAKPLPRTELTKKLWAYIKKKGLQDKKVKTQINADDALKAVFNGKKSVSMFEMTKLVSGHLKK
jgi:chromatin remodeling complex protein RSC6